MTPAMYAGVVAVALGAVFYIIALFRMGDRGADGWLALGIACMVGGFIVLMFGLVSTTKAQERACHEKGGVLVKEVCIDRNVVIR
jgi:Na+/melibiose symporter-like transporter